MEKVKFLKEQLKENQIKYKTVEKIENKKPCYWVDLKIILNELGDYEIIRLPAYNKANYKESNYQNYITNRVKTIKKYINKEV